MSLPVLQVEVSGRFVGEDDAGIVGERAGDGDALLLPAGHFAAACSSCGGRARRA